MVTNGNESQPPLVLGNDIWKAKKTDVSLFIVVMIAIVGEGGGQHRHEGGGGAKYPERTEEREGKKTRSSPTNNDSGNACLRR